jgi:RimJ/RimL family protein N-acetyltransferase
MRIIYKVLDEQGLADYRKIWLECLETFPDNFGTTYLEAYQAQTLKLESNIMQSDANSFMLAAYAGANIIGICGFLRENRLKTAHRGEIVQMYVNPNFAGQGIGNKLLTYCIEKAFKNPEIEQIILTVVAENAKAIYSYKKVGFESYGHLENYFKSGNHYTSQEFMILTRQTYKK